MKSLLLATVLLTPLLHGSQAGRFVDLEAQLLELDVEEIAKEAREAGDPRRGAVVFYQASLACTRCHIPDEANNRLGPDLTALARDVSDRHLVESILRPSKSIREGFESVLLERDGEFVTGLLVSESETTVVIRDAARDYKQVSIDRSDLDDYGQSPLSVMPSGLANLLSNRQQFLDLVRYLIELRDGGSVRARELEPDPALYALRPLPEYEAHVDHAGLIRDLDQGAFKRGQQVYEQLCVNCHGTREQEGSLPTSLKFASQPFKNGNDPHSMYNTLTRGFGMMVAQTWMVPSQKYDVIHYVREAYLKTHNASEYFAVDEAYLGGLPAGTTRGPEPTENAEWKQMDYGPNQVMTMEVGDDATNFAYKGNAIRLDAGPGGVAQGRYWMLFDYDTLRMAAAWSGDEFIDWNSIHFNGRHAIHPRLAGDLQLENPTGPGWGRPSDGSFEDRRLVGRDDRRYGPLERSWAQFRGMYAHGPDTILEYTVGDTRVLEMPGVLAGREARAFTRTFNVGARKDPLVLQVAHRNDPQDTLEVRGTTVWFGDLHAETSSPETSGEPSKALVFNGSASLEVEDCDGLNVGSGDFSLTARIKTKGDGTLMALTGDQEEWLANGLTWFVRDGRLAVDIGWVGAFHGKQEVADNKWHEVALTYEQASGQIRFYVDGVAEKGEGSLQRKASLTAPVLRIGFTASNFPNPSPFVGEFSRARFFNSKLEPDQVRALASLGAVPGATPAASWDLKQPAGEFVPNEVGGGFRALVRTGSAPSATSEVPPLTVVGVEGQSEGMHWSLSDGDLRLYIPAGVDDRRFTLWFATAQDRAQADKLVEALVIDVPAPNLTSKTRGGPARWSQVLRSDAEIGQDTGPFAVDVLKRPTDNPWFCRMRLTGFDFEEGGDSVIVSAWDGSVWRVSGLASLPSEGTRSSPRSVPLAWQRIASGLFQPLGVKILDGKAYVICRDQIVILHDLNGDGETDWYECFNNDHQVTDHFHEFAMGLQSDAEGNLLYAKSARHALPALVPHHGTLLRVSKDGSRTEIVANGFRAANGVCLNPDGTFIVTDQEGHWNPKNRINYVKPGGFYGNMFGYHDVTDESDSAMEQPLVWITNNFDRSPGELLWVDSPKWGPLNGRLLNLSYGAGRVYVVPHEDVNGQMQGGMCALPIQDFPTGVMRGRFHPDDGQLYLAGMFAWAGSKQQPGGLYRLRATGQPVHLPVELSASQTGMRLHFSGPLEAEAAEQAANYHVKVWDLKRTRNYGSPHLNERSWPVTSAELSADGHIVQLTIPDIAPTWCMEIRYELRTRSGEVFKGTVHNTIHELK